MLEGRFLPQNAPLLTHPPEPGQYVHVRGGAYVVQEVVPTPPYTHTDGSTRPGSTLVRLASLQDNEFGQNLEVIWELEPGVRLRQHNQMPEPDRFDPPHMLDAFLDAVRWGAVVQADHAHIQAPFRGGVQPEFYQLEPVVRAITMPRANLLIADDVGLGKTIEAGLVIQELLIRSKARTVLIVCPSALQVQWQEQMRDKFGLTFNIIDSAALRALRRARGPRANPWSSYPRLITSIDYIKRPNPSRLFEDLLPHNDLWLRPFDVLILDEAHNAAPASSGNYAVDSQRTRIVRKLSKHFEHKLFLTATPHNGDPNSWTALLELLDNQRFTRGIEPNPEQLQRVLVRRLKTDIRTDLGQLRFQPRQIQSLAVDYTEEERELYDAFRDYAALRLAKRGDAQQDFAVAFTLKLLKKRLFSSPGSFWRSIDHHKQRLSQARTAAGPGRKREVERGLRHLKSYLVACDDEDYDNDEHAQSETLERLDYASGYHPPLDSEEQQLLDALCAGAKRLEKRLDRKAERMLNWLETHIRPNGVWSDERVIIFTEYRDTLNWLWTHLSSHGFVRGGRTATIVGGIATSEREQVKAAFQADPARTPVRILLATDAAGEGLDLQNHCRYLIHYEIPWNPNRLEQRNGRIDRHGQERVPEIFHFVGSDFDENRDPRDLRAGSLDGDLEFLAIAVRKIEQIREDLGTVGPVIAEHIEKAMLQERRSLDTRAAEARASTQRQHLSFERDMARRIRELEARYHQTRRELGLTPEALANAVHTGLELARRPPLIPFQHSRSGRFFTMPKLEGSWQACSAGLIHPAFPTDDPRPISFEPESVARHDDAVLVHLGHELVQHCLRLLRAEVWSTQDSRRLARACARLVADGQFPEAPHIHLVVHARLLVIGASHQRLHEELIVAGGRLIEGKFKAVKPAQLQALLAAASTDQPSAPVSARLAEAWPQLRQPLTQALTRVVDRHSERLVTMLHQQCADQLAKINAIFDELNRELHKKLAEALPQQLSLFAEEERVQLHSDREALERRHKGLAAERQRELAQAERRFAAPHTRHFPVAITWLVPQSQNR